MNALRREDKIPAESGFERSMKIALAGFEADSRLARRALRVKMAISVFGVGAVLPNDLPMALPPGSVRAGLVGNILQ
ncbi:hypothetical protein [Pseudomonas sp. NY5710]|uniref:hypothetical protein n=1 Tax=Pseudomonas TaxID=286 RepID=UPI0015703E20|nr:hypothetical protein [Pseudomonas sp. NY5710]QKL01666.1 hypothetical protein GEV39_09775 [Pseudomonas sp. NY5710]